MTDSANAPGITQATPVGRSTNPRDFLSRSNDPRTIAWLEAESHASRAILDALPTRPGFLSTIEGFVAQPLDSPCGVAGDWVFVLRREQIAEGFRRSLWCVSSTTGAWHELWPGDRTAVVPDERLITAAPTPDGTLCAAFVMVPGKSASVLFLAVPEATEKFPRLNLVSTRGISWNGSGSSLLTASPAGLPLLHFLGRAGLHRPPIDIGLNADMVRFASDGHTIVLDTAHAACHRFSALMLANDQLTDPNGGPFTEKDYSQALFGPANWNVVDVYGGFIWQLTDRLHPCRSVLRAPLESPEKAEEVIPGGSGVITWMHLIPEHVVLAVQDGMQSLIRVYSPDGKLQQEHRFALPSCLIDIEVDILGGRLVFGETSPLEGRRIWQLDVLTESLTCLWRFPEHSLDDRAEVRTGTANASDGTVIPYWLLGRKDVLCHSEPVPTILSGYGAFNDLKSVGPVWRMWPWIEAGGLYARTFVRGDGFYGRGGYRAGAGTNRLTAVGDFLSVAELLLAKGYTTPKKFGLLGVSAGGWLVAMAALQRPELFKAVVGKAAVTDPAPFTGWGTPQFRLEWSGDREALRHYSLPARVETGVDYPAFYFSGTPGDYRVPFASQSGRLAVALREADSEARVLLAPRGQGQHGFETHSTEGIEETADYLAFFAHELGLSP